MSGGALEGVRVVDLTTILMGPLASRMLGDHGAEVIRVESPAAAAVAMGDDSGLGGIALDLHRNKRSVVLDLKSEVGARAIAELVASADVVVSNMRAQALERLGLDADTLRARHPELIHCVANGYGADGPYADRAAYDDAIQAASGLAALPTKYGKEPAYVPSVIVDKTCSLYIVQAVMAALLHRGRTGEGQTIRVSMFETMVSFLLVEHWRGAAFLPPRGPMGYSRLLNPNRKPYRSADGWVALLPYSGRNWRDFLEGVGRADMMDDPRLATHQSRMANAVELYAVIDEVSPTRTTEEWLAFCDEHSIPAAPVLDMEALQDDPHLQAVGLFTDVEHPDEGPYRSVGDPISYDTMVTGLREHTAQPGADTEAVLTELGLPHDDIAAALVAAESHQPPPTKDDR